MILNLTEPTKSEINYKISKFPDGQQQVAIHPNSLVQDGFGKTEKVIIKSHLNNFSDLELIICTVATLRNLKIKEIHLYVPYFVGARSDRNFGRDREGFVSNHYLKQVICPIINSLNLESVTVLDNHSDVLEACLNNFEKIINVELVRWALKQIDNTYKAQENIAIVSPDGGALKKVFDTMLGVNLTCDLIMSSKHRDLTKNGALSHFEVPLKPHQRTKTLVWVDDIIDGGGTFIGEVEEAIKQGHVGKRYLIVTHGIFSAGFMQLSKYFDGIYCTNSYKDIKEEPGHSIVKQLNVY